MYCLRRSYAIEQLVISSYVSRFQTLVVRDFLGPPVLAERNDTGIQKITGLLYAIVRAPLA
jgi:hypothetical protein